MPTLLQGGTIIDGTGSDPVYNAYLLIEEDKISYCGHDKPDGIPEHTKTIDVSGKTIIPGLIDSHIHMDLHGFADTYEENLTEDKLRTIRAAKEMNDTLMAGFTTVRNLGSVNGIDFAVKTAIEKDCIKGPHIITSGNIISITAQGNNYFHGLYREADGADEVRKAAREQLKQGADVLKIMATGAVMNPGGVPGAPQFNIDEIRAVVEEGQKLGIRTSAHAHGKIGIMNAIKAGCATIEHGTYMDEEVIEFMIKHGTYLVPTISVDYHMQRAGAKAGVPQFMLDKMAQGHGYFMSMLEKAAAAGVKIAAGTDAGTNYNFHGLNAMEIILYVRSGIMTPLAAIRAGTLQAASALGIDKETGSLVKGKQADIVVVDGLLQDNLEALIDGVSMVFKAGERVK